MKITRRGGIVTLGVLVAGAGLFRSSSASDNNSRGAGGQVSFESDSQAFLGIEPGGVEDRSNVSASKKNGVVSLTIERINKNALTVIENILEITNKGNRRIKKITVSVTDESENAKLAVQNDFKDDTPIGTNESVQGLRLTIDTTVGNGAPEIRGTIEISSVQALKQLGGT